MEVFYGYDVKSHHHELFELHMDDDLAGSTDEESVLSALISCDAGSDDFDYGDVLSPTAIDDLDLELEATLKSFGASRCKRRKRTYELRKDEIDILAKKSKCLEAKLGFLKHRAGVVDEQSVVQTSMNNLMLREVLRNQQYLIAGIKSMMASDTSEHVLSPVATPVHLGKEPLQRRKTLKSLKYQKLHDAKRYIEKRTQFSNMSERFSESTRSETDNGDTVSVKFDIVPLHDAKSVKQVYDAILFYFANFEICMTEALGDLTVREEHDAGKNKDNIAQHRFLYSTNGVQIETNSVLFSEYKRENQPSSLIPGGMMGGEEGLVTTDFVDVDEIFPYRPNEHVRKDITSILHVKTCPAGPRTPAPDSEDEDSDRDGAGTGAGDSDDQVVVLTMWFQWRLRRSEFEIPEAELAALVDDTDRVHNAILKSVRASLRAMSA
uniref:Uncharacterized protein n=1 Tax=Globisporangium ultimum (strain ATCC 200006 / CBS 805.95 / DAOM BR144) TaxID=431595 RepID=K3WCR6_GLOUD